MPHTTINRLNLRVPSYSRCPTSKNRNISILGVARIEKPESFAFWPHTPARQHINISNTFHNIISKMVSAVRADATEVPCPRTNPLAQTVYPLQGGKVHPSFENNKKFFSGKKFLASTTTRKIRSFHWCNPFLNPLTIKGDIWYFVTAASTTTHVGRYFALGNTCPVQLFLVILSSAFICSYSCGLIVYIWPWAASSMDSGLTGSLLFLQINWSIGSE